MKQEVAAAIEEIVAGLPEAKVQSMEDGDGGAYVLVEPLDIGENFAPSSTWVGFHISFPYPEADVYPHFLDPSVKYAGAKAAPNQFPDGNLPAAMSRGATMPGFDKPAIQVSRRSNRRNAETDSALHKLLRVLEFLRTR